MDTDWNLILAQGETARVDFKAPMAWEGTARADLAEDIVAMSNVRDGGTILIGVAEGPDGRPVVEGLTSEQLASFDPTKVCDYVAGYFQPVARLRIERPEIAGKTIIAIRVEEFESTPLICIKDGPEKRPDSAKPKRAFYAGNLIVRTPSAKSETIRTSEDMQALIRLAISKTSNLLLSDMRRILEGVSTKAPEPAPERHARELTMWSEALGEWRPRLPPAGLLSVTFLPDSTAEGLAFSHAAWRKMIGESSVQLRNHEFPRYFVSEGVAVQNRPDCVQGTASFDYYQEIWQLHASGAFLYAGLLREDLDPGLRAGTRVPDAERYLEFVYIMWRVVFAVLFAQRLYEVLSPNGNIRYRFVFTEMQGRQLATTDIRRSLYGRRSQEREIEIEGTTSTLDLRSGWRGVVHDVLRQLFVLFNLDIAPAVIDDELNALERSRG